jgi:hypothetical protein
MDSDNQKEVNEVREPQESYGGWIKLYRQITESKIWETKPSSWVVCWIYILLKVSFVNNNSYKKGEAHFRSVEYEALPFDITNRIWYNCLNWLEQEGMIKRRKVWRGEVITVLNYEKYQNNLSSENCKTGLEVNHMSIIEQQLKPNLNDKNFEQKNDTGKSYVNQREIINQTNIDKMQAQDMLKNIRSIRSKNKDINNINNISNDNFLGSSLKDEKDLKDTTPLLSVPPSKLAKSQPIMFNEQTLKLENIPIEKLNKWKETFNCDVEAEIKKMEVWLSANPERRKKNYERFIYNWLSKASEKSSNTKSQPKSEPKKEAGYGYF